MRESKQILQELILSEYPLIYVVTDDERPVVDYIKKMVLSIDTENTPTEKGFAVRTWDSSLCHYDEVKKIGKTKVRPEKSTANKEVHTHFTLLEYIHFIEKCTQPVVGFIHDIHEDLKRNHDLIRRLKSFAYDASLPYTAEHSLSKYENQQEKFPRYLILTSPVYQLPKELEKFAYVVDFQKPQKKDIGDLLNAMQKELKFEISEDEKEKVVQASIGLSEHEIYYTYKRSLLINDHKINHQDIFEEKKQIIKKQGHLEFIENTTEMKDVGGLDSLRDWIEKRKILFNEEVRIKHRIDTPKGLLLTGVQGCGKSHSVKAIASYLDIPLLRFDLGSLLQSSFGSSDKNVRDALSLAENLSPCVLWIDEMEKIMPQSNKDTHEVIQRVFGYLLTWLQEKEKPVFVIATTNQIEHLPPELLRKGRFDEIFFIDLPSQEERKSILHIHMEKRNLSSRSFNIEEISSALEGFSGAEIENIINETIISAVNLEEEVSTQLFLNEITKTSPLSKTMKQKVDSLRSWAIDHNVRMASSERLPTSAAQIGF